MESSLPIVPSAPPRAKKPPVDPSTLVHRQLRGGDFWRAIPAYKDVDEATFLDHRWQSKHSITRPEKLLETLRGVASAEFIADVENGFHRAPMTIRVSPYILSLIDWERPHEDPLRRQFITLGSALRPDHPKLDLDSLHEQEDSPTPGLTHRYPDKALFLALDTCPVYCRFCTRSYAVGTSTDKVEKVSIKANPQRWEAVFEYIASRPELEDIVISGGDSYNLRDDQIAYIGNRLLEIPQIRRMRFATKGPAVMPMKILSDEEWLRALVGVVERGRKLHKDVMLHTHWNHPNEMTEISQRAMNRLIEAGVHVRNQSVLLRGVNDTPAAMTLLIKRMSYLGVHAYYVYQHDLVKGVEDLRTTVDTAIELEKEVRGLTAGFNTPTFVVDAPGGGGKRDVHSFEHYNRETGVSVYRSPNVNREAYYLYFDPIDLLPEAGQRRWADAGEHDAIVAEALAAAKSRHR
ncbi:MAG TPA: KamA family radical SAM protein [Nannocystaceae bacterium]|nr:KamA family radical SAM protein [Nannocystaceae bacterium]